MSVYKSQRNVAISQFTADARILRKETIRIIKKFPTSYRWVITNNILELASEIYTKSLKANAIPLTKEIRESDLELRHRLLLETLIAAEAFAGEITLLYEMVNEGNNFFKDKEQYNKTFSNWITKVDNLLKSLNHTIQLDENIRLSLDGE